MQENTYRLLLPVFIFIYTSILPSCRLNRPFYRISTTASGQCLTFDLYILAAAESVQQAKTSCKMGNELNMGASDTKRYKVLWADDDKDDLELFRGVLLDLTPDYEILEFENGKEVLDHLAALNPEQYPCLIILDMNMPVLNGRDTLSILKKDPVLKDIPVVVFTTSSSPLDKMFCKQLNTDMLTKPPSYESILQVVQKLVTYCKQ